MKRQTMTQEQFRELTNEVAIEIDVNQKFIAFKTLHHTRTKRAVSKLTEKGYNAKVNPIDKQYLILQL